MEQFHNSSVEPLFEPMVLGSLRLPNRIVMAPMTRYGCHGGLAGADVAEYYARRAAGGVALLISEGAFVDRPATRVVDSVPYFNASGIESWRPVVEAVHAHGAKLAPQLWHVGASKDFSVPELPAGLELESPSGISALDLSGGRPLTEEGIADVVTTFVQAARASQALGFDAVQFHGAHGYLFDQFFWSATNKRTDGYGGLSIGDRARFAVETVRAVRQALGPDFPLMFRISQWKTYFYDVKLAETPDELAAWLEPLAEAGVDIFDCSQRRFETPEFEGSDLNLAGWAKKLTGKASITVGSIGLSSDMFVDFEHRLPSAPNVRSAIEAAERLDRGEFDLVALGRALIAEADWPRKVREGRFDEIRPYSVDLLKELE